MLHLIQCICMHAHNYVLAPTKTICRHIKTDLNCSLVTYDSGGFVIQCGLSVKIH